MGCTPSTSRATDWKHSNSTVLVGSDGNTGASASKRTHKAVPRVTRIVVQPVCNEVDPAYCSDSRERLKQDTSLPQAPTDTTACKGTTSISKHHPIVANYKSIPAVHCNYDKSNCHSGNLSVVGPQKLPERIDTNSCSIWDLSQSVGKIEDASNNNGRVTDNRKMACSVHSSRSSCHSKYELTPVNPGTLTVDPEEAEDTDKTHNVLKSIQLTAAAKLNLWRERSVSAFWLNVNSVQPADCSPPSKDSQYHSAQDGETWSLVSAEDHSDLHIQQAESSHLKWSDDSTSRDSVSGIHDDSSSSLHSLFSDDTLPNGYPSWKRERDKPVRPRAAKCRKIPTPFYHQQELKPKFSKARGNSQK